MKAVEQLEIEALKQMGPIRRVEVACEMFDFVREFLTVNIRADHPDWPEERVQTAVRERLQNSQ